MPPLPVPRHYHTTFLTLDPHPSIATCGGSKKIPGENFQEKSCVVLDKVNNRWDAERMGDLTMPRYKSAVASLDSLGVFIIGGSDTNSRWKSEFLAAGTSQWQQGPDLPVEMREPCAVVISPTSFLAIFGKEIHEFDAWSSGPTNKDGWKKETWPLLKNMRNTWAGCAKLDQKVIITGGWDGSKSGVSTEVLDLVSHQVISAGDMAVGRRAFHLATLKSGALEKVLAIGGITGGWPQTQTHDTVEEWVDADDTWRQTDRLTEGRAYFGELVVEKDLLCSGW